MKGNFLDKAYNVLFRKNKEIKQVLLWYLFISLFGGILLWIPFTHVNNQEISFIDSMFISSSAFSDTGLSTLTISESYNFLGQLIILILIIIGGIGFFTVRVFIINFIFRKKINREEREIVSQELSSFNINKSMEIIKTAVITMFISIFIFGFIFGILFALVDASPLPYLPAEANPNLKGNWSDSIWTGFFHATSAINNAGFDIFVGDYSMQGYYGNYFIQFLTIFLFVMGGIGFAIIYDLVSYFKNLSKGKKFKFSVFTKVSATAYLIVAVLGLLITYSSEAIDYWISGQNSFYGKDDMGTTFDKTWALAFNTFSTRNAGFSTINVWDLNWFTKINFSTMMFIGSGPGSTAGGIRTTSFMVLTLILISKIRRKDNVTIFNREIDQETQKMAKRVFVFSFALVIMSSFLISIDELLVNPDDIIINGNQTESLNYLDVLFVTASAFGTTGLSTFSLSTVGIFTKIWLIFIMFIGQFGAVNTLIFVNVDRFKKQKIESEKIKVIKEKSIYPKENIPL